MPISPSERFSTLSSTPRRFAPSVETKSYPAAEKPLKSASVKSAPTPSTSPVDFISGPSRLFASGTLPKENTGTLTAQSGGAFHSPSGQPRDSIVSPIMTRVAMSTIGTPVTLLRYGTVREALGFTSMTHSRPSYIRYWMFTSPRVPSARARRRELEQMSSVISSPRSTGG